jgi:hypothetical protein
VTTSNDGWAGPDPASPPDGGDYEQHSASSQVDDLVRANAKSNATMMRLVEKVREDAQMRGRKVELLDQSMRQTRRLLIMVAATLVLLMGLGVVNAVNLNDARHNAAVTAATAKNADSTYTLLLDCLNARGECGKLNAQSQKRLLDEVKLYELTVLYCVRINPLVADPRGAQFIKCVNELYPGGPQLNTKPATE